MISYEHREEGDRREQELPDQACEGEWAGTTCRAGRGDDNEEIAGSAKEGLLALAVGAGLQVMQVLMEEQVTEQAQPGAGRLPPRTRVTLGGRRTPIERPRVRAADGSELAVPAYELFSQTELLGAMALERMLAGLSTRRYRVGLAARGRGRVASATSRSAVSRKFVRAKNALAELLAAPLHALDLVALMVDGVLRRALLRGRARHRQRSRRAAGERGLERPLLLRRAVAVATRGGRDRKRHAPTSR